MWIDPRVADITLRDYLADWLEKRARMGRHGVRYQEDAARLVRLHVAPPLGHVWLSDLTVGMVNRWHDQLVASRLADTGSVGLVPAKAYRLLHAALEDAVRDQVIPKNPCVLAGAGVERSPERPLLEPGQVIDLADAVPPRWRAMVLIAGWCGLRFGELAALRRRDVDLLHGTLRVRQALGELSSGELVEKDPKTDAGRRTIAVPAPLLEVLEDHLAGFVDVDPDARVFTAPRGGPLRRSNFGDDWRKAVRAAGLDRVAFHDLRHAAGTLAAQLGATERELQARLGHASPAAARRYQHAAEARDRELADRIGAAFTLSAAGRAGGRVEDLGARSARKRDVGAVD
ncbi:MAG: tyrosine-type recombinase/integrase [Acidimicrobiia bacterium]